jgi:hypothetical protein
LNNSSSRPLATELQRFRENKLNTLLNIALIVLSQYDGWLTHALLLLLQAYRDLMYWGGRMSDLVVDLTADMEAHAPPPHSLGAHMLACKMQDSGAGGRVVLQQAQGRAVWAPVEESTNGRLCFSNPCVSSRMCMWSR